MTIFKSQGFTLVELLIVVAIIGIIAAFAYPNYQRYVVKTKRTEMMSQLQGIAAKIEAQKLVQGTYTDITLNNVLGGNTTGGIIAYPQSGQQLYDVSLWDISGNTPAIMSNTNMTSDKWQLRAVPKTNSQVANDGTLTLDNSGIKCRASVCGSNWNN